MKKVTGNIYQLESSRRCNPYLIKGQETILIDTGFPGTGKAILNELRSNKISPDDIKHIFLTHHDLDHVANAVLFQKLSGASLWASKEDAPYVTGEKSRYGIKKLFPYIFRIKKPASINIYPENEALYGIDIIKTPGHTPGHVCMLYDGVLFIGDLLKNEKGPFKPFGPIMTWNKSKLEEAIKIASQLEFKWVCPSHGNPVECSSFW